MQINIQLFADGEENPPAPAPENTADKWKDAYDALLAKFNERDAELVAVKQELQEANAQLRNAPLKTEPTPEDDFNDFDDFIL